MDSGQATYELSPQKLVPLDAITQRAREFPTSRSACRLDQAASIFNAPLFDLHDDFNSTNRDLDSTPDLCLTFARSAAITFKQEARKIHIHNSTPKLCLNNSRFNLDVVLNMDGVGLNMDRVRLESDSGLKLTRIPSTPTSRRRNYASTARGPLVWAGVGAWFNFKALELIQRPAMPGSTQVQSQALYRRTEHLALTQHAIELTTTYLESRDSEIHFVATPRLCEFEPSQRKNNIEWTPTNQNSRIPTIALRSKAVWERSTSSIKPSENATYQAYLAYTYPDMSHQVHVTVIILLSPPRKLRHRTAQEDPGARGIGEKSIRVDSVLTDPISAGLNVFKASRKFDSPTHSRRREAAYSQQISFLFVVDAPRLTDLSFLVVEWNGTASSSVETNVELIGTARRACDAVPAARVDFGATADSGGASALDALARASRGAYKVSRRTAYSCGLRLRWTSRPRARKERERKIIYSRSPTYTQGSSSSGYAQEEERTALCTRIPRSEVSERRACEKVESALSDGQHSGDTERARASGAARDDLFEAALLAGGRSEARAQAGALEHRHNGGSRRPRHSTALTALESERGWCALHAVADWRAACVREWRMARMEDEACAMRMFEGRRLCARTSNARRCADRAGVDARTEQGPERGRARRWWTNEMYDVRSLAKEKQARQTYLRRRRRDKTTCGEGRINGALAALVTCLVSVTLNTHLILVQKPPQTMTSFKKIFMKIAVAVKKAAAKVKTSGATVAPRTVAPFLGPPPAYVPPPSYEEATDPGPKERENDLLALDH
ncbi:hypothetical protein DFH06DRAFT_1141876 [Mycena polygramma]|nr:hypothetical protein DFH06DRAFT_1141876 [Mycena polygramma]